MLSTFIQFCVQWVGADPQWSKLLAFLLVLLVSVGPKKTVTVKKVGKNKWTIFR